MRLVVACALVLTGGCAHVIHPTAVAPGGSVGVLVAPFVEHHVGGAIDGRDVYGMDVQLEVRHGWRFENGGASLAVLGGFSANDEAGGAGLEASHALGGVDGYAQLLDGPIDIGVGILLPFPPEIYVMLGRRIDLSNHLRLSIDVLGSFQFVGDYGTMGSVQVGLERDDVRVGVFVDGYSLWDVEYSENAGNIFSAQDDVDERRAVGLLVAYTPR